MASAVGKVALFASSKAQAEGSAALSQMGLVAVKAIRNPTDEELITLLLMSDPS
jgi:hypothetical protein